MTAVSAGFLFAGIAAASASAQEDSRQAMMRPLPNDPAVRIGHLDNGLTYYIRQNALPAHRAEFYLATNVGAIQETPDQDGLAHFLEHMCFNGTKNFPDKGILNYLRSIGAEFGRNINASTGFEETQYMLNNMPVERESVVDSCLIILKEYAHFVVNDPVEIDKERGVIIEERRQRRNAQWRTLERSLPYYFGDSKYATCTLIGQQTSLENFKPESLHAFYETWYHPGNQAVVVVGDVDVDRTEAKIREIFSVIPKKENPKQKDVIKVPGHKEPLIGILTDPETTSPSIEMLWESDAMPEEYNATIIGQMQGYLKNLVSQIMYERFKDITSKPDSPYIAGAFGIGDVIYESLEAGMADVTLKEDNLLDGFKAFYTEIERMKRFGFYDDEFERAKTNLLNYLENGVKKADTRRNPEFVRPILQNFFDKEPILDPATDLELGKQLLSQMNAQVLSQVAAQIISDENLVVIYSGPEKEGIATPTAEQLKAAIDEVKASDIQPRAGEEIASEFLDPATLKGAKAKVARKPGIYGSTVWTLKNGVKVTLLPTDYTKDQILFDLYKDGGKSLIPVEDLASFNESIFNMYVHNTGVAGFSGTQVSKMLTGKTLSVTPYINELDHGIKGNTTPKDLETTLQLIYLFFVEPRFDKDEFDNGINQYRAVLPNLVNQPDYKFADGFYKLLYGNNPRRQQLNQEILDKANLESLGKYYRKLFNDAAGTNLVLVGDVDLVTLKPLVEKYIGSIPKGKKALSWVDPEVNIVKGEVIREAAVDMQTPKNTVIQVYSAGLPYSEARKAALDAAKYILDMRYVNSLREEEGGTYGASTSIALSRKPKQEGIIQVYFDCKPALCDKLRALAKSGLKDLAEQGPTDEEITAAILNLKKNIPESRVSNSYWRSNIENFIDYGTDRDVERENAINALNKDAVKAVLQEILASGNLVEYVMKPANAAEVE